ncbi:MAG: hypothetical protein GXY20_07390 [Clostridiales bacterium]|nr:hypothetical protein [Clostridiales bacterium]
MAGKTAQYTVPEYYGRFLCKCGECRHNCCCGWPVNISKEEYLRLKGADCAQELREKLIGAMNVNPNAPEDKYAHLVHNKSGKCVLCREDGLCGLQVELGEGILPDVCRLYPRNTRRLPEADECACANSCEAVIEQLIALSGPLRFVKAELPGEPMFEIDMTPEQYDECKEAVLIMQNRGLSLPERFFALGERIFGVTAAEKTPGDMSGAFKLNHILAAYYAYDSKIVRGLCLEAMRYYEMTDKKYLAPADIKKAGEKHRAANEHFTELFPDWEIFFEQLIVNHMFYNNFPHIGGTAKSERAFISLCVTYSFLRFVLLACMAKKSDRESAVDVLATLFRLIEHSDFKYRAITFFPENQPAAPDFWPQFVHM